MSLPTGYGRTLCYSVLPRLFDKKYGDMYCKKSLVFVVSPLLALMENQVTSLTAHGLTAGAISQQSTPAQKQLAKQGKFQLLFLSPGHFFQS